MVRPICSISFSLLLSLLTGFAAGMFVSFCVGICCLCVLIVCFFIPSFRSGSKTFALILSGLFIGSMMFCLVYKIYITPVLSLAGKTYDASAVIVDLPDAEGENGGFLLDVNLTDQNGAEQSFKVSAYDTSLYNCDIFDTVRCRISFEQLESTNRLGNMSRRCFIACKIQEIYEIKSGSPSFLDKMFYDLKRHFILSVESNIGSDSSGIVEAISLGNKKNISLPVQNDLRLAGVSHLVAISGLHIYMIADMLSSLFFSLKIKRKWAFVLSSSCIWFFVITIGAPLSAVRAATMFTAYCFASAFYNRMDQINSLSFAVLLVCLISPFAAADIGFLCSVSATLGIIIIHPSIKDFITTHLPLSISRFKIISSSLEMVSTSISATISTLPCMVLFFHQISFIALIFNIIAIPLATEALFFSLIGNVLSFSTALSAPFITIGGAFAKIITMLAELFAKIPFASISTDNKWFIIWFVVVVLLIASGYILHLLTGKKRLVIRTIAILCTVNIVFCTVAASFDHKALANVYVLPDENTVAAIIHSPTQKGIVYLSDGNTSNTDSGIASLAYKSGYCRLDYMIVGSSDNIYLPNIAKICKKLEIKKVLFYQKEDLSKFKAFLEVESVSVFDETSFSKENVTCTMADSSCLLKIGEYKILLYANGKSNFSKYDAVVCHYKYVNHFVLRKVRIIVPSSYSQIQRPERNIIFCVYQNPVAINIYPDKATEYTLS